MAKIVAIYGIGQQYLGGQTLHTSWYPALADGLQAAGKPRINPNDLDLVFYGDVFRPAGAKSGIPLIMPEAITEGSDLADGLVGRSRLPVGNGQAR